ncbi:MAG: hypothetical protein E6J80_13005 [Deltaproteobacteria bacterium]|nr:MAG: hypothetical protein E6J80_13005 [Deltaproteobacteria bacterium]
MDKKTRGLPPSFQLDVARAAVERPVQLGDYLDEEEAAPVAKPVAPPDPTAAPAELPRGRHTEPAAPSTSAPVHQARVRPRFPVPKPTRLATTVPRKQVNMTPETLHMVDEILDYVRTYGVQKDTKASELFHALVLALYEARDYLDLSRVQPRGRWGTPTAAAFPTAIKNAIQAAIADWHYGNKN